MMKWLVRIALGLVAVALVLVSGGAVYEQIARMNAATEFPPRGRLVDIGGRRIQLDCRGTGSPIVVFSSRDWMHSVR